MIFNSTRRHFSAHLKENMGHIVSKRQAQVTAFKKEHAGTTIGEVTIGSVMGGMRGLPGMFYETSKLDANDGIFYRGHSLRDV